MTLQDKERFRKMYIFAKDTSFVSVRNNYRDGAMQSVHTCQI